MPVLSERLGSFSAALLNPAVAPPSGLVGPDGMPSPRRFAVYRNNVVVGLTEALKSNFPAVARIVGDAFFLAMARAYAAASPPVSPVLLAYGGNFPDFIAAFEPAADLTYLADVATSKPPGCKPIIRKRPRAWPPTPWQTSHQKTRAVCCLICIRHFGCCARLFRS